MGCHHLSLIFHLQSDCTTLLSMSKQKNMRGENTTEMSGWCPLYMIMFSAVAFCFEISRCAVDGSCSATMKTCSKFTVGHHHDVNINLDYIIVDVENLTGEAWVGDSNSSTSSSNCQHTGPMFCFITRECGFSHTKSCHIFLCEKNHILL